MLRYLHLPYDDNALSEIRAGDDVVLSGTLYVGRDQVHKRLYDSIISGSELPFSFSGNAIYYMGPSPAKPGDAIGAAGPTTSARMDPFSPYLIKAGLKVMVGKGPRSQSVIDAVKKYGGLYLQAFGGCGALYSSCIEKSVPVAYPELGPEALIKLTISDFPVIAVIDSLGNVYSG